MAFDGIVTKAVVTELNKNIIEARVEKINMPNKLDIVITLHNNSKKLKLLISANPTSSRIHFTKIERDNPIKAFQFCMVLRKHLQGSRIIKVEQYELDRIIKITFEGLNDFGDKKQCHLIIEIMGKHSNIILTDDNNKILDSIRHVDSEMSSLREVLPAREYIYPQNQNRDNFIGMSLQDFTLAVHDAVSIPGNDSFDFSKRLANEFTGFSRTFTNNLCNYLKIDNEITKKNISDLYSSITILFYNINEGLANLVEINNDYHFDLTLYSTNSSTTTPISDFLDEYYNQKEKEEYLHNKQMDLQKQIINSLTKFEKKLATVKDIMAESEDVDYYKQCGELITSNIYRIKQGMNEIEVENFYDNNKLINISLNENYSPSKNAQVYFKKYTKLRNAMNYALKQKEFYEKNIEYLELVSYQVNECNDEFDLIDIQNELESQGIIKKIAYSKDKSKNVHSECLKYEKDGIEILVGKNNIQNDNITFKVAKKTDTWLHTKDIHGSHVIIRSNEVSNDVLLFAAKLASKHSQAKGYGKISVDYTLVKNVKKIPGNKPGMVTYTNFKTIIV